MSKRDCERRRKARRIAETTAIIDALKAMGKNCGNCRHFGKAPRDIGGRICELGSDFSGYQMTTADKLCHRHRDKP